MHLINNLDGLDDTSSDEFDPVRHYNKSSKDDQSISGLSLLRQRSNQFAPI